MIGLILAFGLATSAQAQSELLLSRPLSDGVLLPPTSVATDDSTFSLALNPGSLAQAGTGIGYVHEEGDSARPTTRRGDGIFFRIGGRTQGDSWSQALGLSSEWIRPPGGGCSGDPPCFNRVSLGYGIGTGAISAGIAYRWYSSGYNAGIDHLGTLDVGVIARPARWLSIGAVVQALNAPVSTIISVPTAYRFGLGLRPFGSALTLAVDASVDSLHGWPGTKLDYLAQIMAPMGLAISAGFAHPVDWTGRLPLVAEIGLRGTFGNASLDIAGSGFGGGPPLGSGVATIEWSMAHPAATINGGGTAQLLDLSKELADSSGLLDLVGLGEHGLSAYSKVLLRLKRLSDEPRLSVLVIKMGALPVSLARAEELRTRVAELRLHGKKVLFWMQSGGDTEYYVATSGDRIYAVPQTGLEINGLATTRIHLRGLLDKVGVKPEFVKIGAYKSAPEEFTQDTSSPAAAEETNAILDDQFARYITEVAMARKLPIDRVKALIDRGVFTVDDALTSGLIDGLAGSKASLSPAISELAGRDLSLDTAGPPDRLPGEWGEPARIAIVEVVGDIVSSSGGLNIGGVATADRIVKALKQAGSDYNVKAVVLRVESPGGDVAASELIWQAVREVRARKPIVASFGDVAASGGYYIAAGADLIVAEPETLTGSIGVFAGKADLSRLFNWLGVNLETFKRGEKADFFTLSRSWTDGERTAVEAMVKSYYDGFVGHVSEGRKLTRAQVDAVGQGHVWTGAQAKERGLVDELGDLQEALSQARRMGGLAADAPVAVMGAEGLFDLESEPLEQAVRAMTQSRTATLTPEAALKELLILGGRADAAAMEAAEPLLRALSTGMPLALAIDLPVAR